MAITRRVDPLVVKRAQVTATTSTSVESLHLRINRALREKNGAYEAALANVKSSRGFLPICADCKKIRNDKG